MCQLYVIDKRTGGAQFRPLKRPEGIECCHIEQSFQALFPVLTVEADGGERRQPFPPFIKQLGKSLFLQPFVRDEDFTRLQAGDLRRQVFQPYGACEKLPGRDIEPGHGMVFTGTREGEQEVMAPGIQQAVLSNGAGGDQPDYLPCDNGFITALFCFCRALCLFRDGDPESLADELLQIAVRGMDRYAAHGDIFPGMFPPLCQRNIERL